MSDTPALHLDHVTRTYSQGEGELEVFRNISLSVMPGELVALAGATMVVGATHRPATSLSTRPWGWPCASR